MKRVFLAWILLVLAVLAGCGGSSKPTAPQVSMTISPSTASVMAGQTQQFTATVTGTTNTAVSWSLSGNGCSGAGCGSIDANGMYRAPSPIPAAATVTIIATSAADPSKQRTATVTHMPVQVSVTPTSVTLISADTKQFSATASNVPSGSPTGVTWTVSGGGTIANSGFYTAPAKVVADSNVIVTATSVFDNSKAGTVTFTIKAATIAVSPGSASLAAGGAQQQFVATLANVPAGQNSVTWSLSGPGLLDPDGLYHSPALVSMAVTAVIQAVSAFDNTKVGKATVSLNPIVVDVLPESITLYAGQTQQFMATVAHHLNQAVTWSVSGTDCAGAACGTIESNGLYTAPSSISTNVTVSVSATAVADTSKSDPATITLIPVSIAMSPKTATVSVNSTKQFAATVAGSANTDATWSVSGSSCTGSDCGTISSTGLYTAPAIVPNCTVTITATAVADPAKSVTATVTVTPNLNAKITGPYAFSYVGYDAAGKPQHAIGSFVADGKGTLNGLIDINVVGAASSTLKTSFAGTYQVFTGGNRGEATFTVSGTPMTFRFSTNGAGERAHMIRFDSSGSYGSGSFKKQTVADFQLSKISGDYVLGLSGTTSSGNERNAAVGRLHTDGTGAMSNTSMDIAETGQAPMTFGFGGNFALDGTTGAENGRGTIAVAAFGQALHFSFYLVSQDEAFLLSTDPTSLDTSLLSGSMLRQTGGPFSTDSMNATSVLYLVGVTTRYSNATTPRSAITIASIFELGNGTGHLLYWFNWGGSQFSGGYSMEAITIDATGRGTCTFNVNAQDLSGKYVLYLRAPNTGFVMQYVDPGYMVNFGYIEPQASGPYYISSFAGDYYGGTVLPAISGVGYGTGVQTWDGKGGWTGIGDVAGGGSPFIPDLSTAGTYALGEWVQTVPAPYHKGFNIVSPNKLLFIPTEPGVVNPGLEIIEK